MSVQTKDPKGQEALNKEKENYVFIVLVTIKHIYIFKEDRHWYLSIVGYSTEEL